MPFFSVIIPAYNIENYIGLTLKSVLAQTFNDYEVVIVDDGSVDGTSRIVEAFNSPKIRLINQDNGGVSKARNTGIQNARGRYIAFLDGDDYWYPDHLQKAFDFFQKRNGVSAYFARFYNMPYGCIPERHQKFSDTVRYIGARGLYFMQPSCSVFSRELLLSLPLWEEGMKFAEDGLYWVRLLRKTRLVGIGGTVSVIYFIDRESSAMNSEGYRTIHISDLIMPMVREIRGLRWKFWKFGAHYFVVRELSPERMLALSHDKLEELFGKIEVFMCPVLEKRVFFKYKKAIISGDPEKIMRWEAKLRKRVLVLSRCLDWFLRGSGLLKFFR